MRDARQSSQWLVEPTEQQKQSTDGASRTWSISYATACANAFRTVPRTLSAIVQSVAPVMEPPFRSPRRSGVVWCRDCGASACAVASLGHAPLRPCAAIAPKRAHVRAHSQANPRAHRPPYTTSHSCTRKRVHHMAHSCRHPVQSRPVREDGCAAEKWSRNLRNHLTEFTCSGRSDYTFVGGSEQEDPEPLAAATTGRSCITAAWSSATGACHPHTRPRTRA